jgi:hypothetical protein
MKFIVECYFLLFRTGEVTKIETLSKHENEKSDLVRVTSMYPHISEQALEAKLAENERDGFFPLGFREARSDGRQHSFYFPWLKPKPGIAPSEADAQIARMIRECLREWSN